VEVSTLHGNFDAGQVMNGAEHADVAHMSTAPEASP